MANEHQRSVIDGVYLRTSASQIQKYDASTPTGCNRRWYFNKVLHLEDGAGKRGDQGTESHSRLEHYEKTGENVLTPHEREALRFLPPPLPKLADPEKPFLLFEQEIEGYGLHLAGVKLTGKIDVLNALGYWIDNEGQKHSMPEGVVEVHDHKTTTNLKWAKTASELATNVQMVLYGWAARAKFPNIDGVRLSHGVIQVPPGGRQARKVSIEVGNDLIDARVAEIETMVERMAVDAAKKDPQDVAPNYAACNAYHKPCPFFDKCVPDHLDRLIGLTVKGDHKAFEAPTNGEKKMSLLNKNRTATTETPAPVQEQSKPSLLARKTPPAPATPSLTQPEPSVGVTPPDAPASDPVLASAGEEGQFHEDAQGQLHVFVKGAWKLAGAMSKSLYTQQKEAATNEGGTVVSKPQSQVIVVDVPAETPAPVVPPPAAPPVASGRGRPSAAETAAAAAQGLTVKEYRAKLSGTMTEQHAPAPVPSAQATAIPPSSTEAPPAIRALVPKADGTGLSLYINCIPPQPAAPLEPYINKIAEKLAASAGGPDIRCSKHDALDFGKWKGALAMGIKQHPPEAGCYTLLSRDELYVVGGEAVAAMTPNVTRGV